MKITSLLPAVLEFVKPECEYETEFEEAEINYNFRICFTKKNVEKKRIQSENVIEQVGMKCYSIKRLHNRGNRIKQFNLREVRVENSKNKDEIIVSFLYVPKNKVKNKTDKIFLSYQET